ncbi:unnamed protein product, partial [Pylaiella littoralis]
SFFQGSGTKLADIPIVPVTLMKIDSDHDLLKAFHALLYGAIGKKTVRKKNIRSFSGFPEGDDTEARVKKLTQSKKWTVVALKDLCTLLGLDKAGNRANVIDRLMAFLASPDPSSSKGPVAKKPKKVTKKSFKVGKKGKKVKREVKPRPLSGYMIFCKETRPTVVKANAEFKATEVMAKLGEMWNKCSDAQKEKYKQQGIKEFEKKQGAKADEGAGDGGDGEDEQAEEASENEEASEDEVGEG